MGAEYRRHCVAITLKTDAAQEIIDRMRAGPQGVGRVNCPFSMIYVEVGEMIARFTVLDPNIQVVLESPNQVDRSTVHESV